VPLLCEHNLHRSIDLFIATWQQHHCTAHRKLTAPFRVATPLHYSWNRVELDLRELCARVFQTNFAFCVRIRVFASCRLRRIYFCDRHYKESELPAALRVVQPSTRGGGDTV
jgi:hypothetical protein